MCMSGWRSYIFPGAGGGACVHAPSSAGSRDLHTATDGGRSHSDRGSRQGVQVSCRDERESHPHIHVTYLRKLFRGGKPMLQEIEGGRTCRLELN